MGQRCLEQRPLRLRPSGRAAAATSRRGPGDAADARRSVAKHGRRDAPAGLPKQQVHGARDMAPQAWATEMQLATKTMLRSVNKQRLKRVKRPRKLKDALALETSPKDVKAGLEARWFIRSRPPPRPPLAGGTGPRRSPRTSTRRSGPFVASRSSREKGRRGRCPCSRAPASTTTPYCRMWICLKRRRSIGSLERLKGTSLATRRRLTSHCSSGRS